MKQAYDEGIGDVVLTAGPANWIVECVLPLDDYRLALAFRDGKQGVFDFKPYLELPCYSSLKDASVFNRVRVECGTAVWSDDVDIAPECLYENCVPDSDIDWKKP